MIGAPSVEDLISSAKNADWSWFEKLEVQFGGGAAREKQLEVEARRRELAGAAARVYDTPDGQLLIQSFVDATLLRQVFVTQLGVDPMQAYAYGAFREGANAFVTQLLKLIAEGQSEPAPPSREITDAPFVATDPAAKSGRRRSRRRE